jgi:hypothetical protein
MDQEDRSRGIIMTEVNLISFSYNGEYYDTNFGIGGALANLAGSKFNAMGQGIKRGASNLGNGIANQANKMKTAVTSIPGKIENKINSAANNQRAKTAQANANNLGKQQSAAKAAGRIDAADKMRQQQSTQAKQANTYKAQATNPATSQPKKPGVDLNQLGSAVNKAQSDLKTANQQYKNNNKNGTIPNTQTTPVQSKGSTPTQVDPNKIADAKQRLAAKNVGGNITPIQQQQMKTQGAAATTSTPKPQIQQPQQVATPSQTVSPNITPTYNSKGQMYKSTSQSMNDVKREAKNRYKAGVYDNQIGQANKFSEVQQWLLR